MIGARAPAAKDGLAVALLAALPLATASAVRVTDEVSVGETFVAVLGCSALSLGAIALLSRGAGDALSGVPWKSACVASFPLVRASWLLATRTHHRALGGVTFAVAAAAMVALSAVVVLRLSALGARGKLGARLTLTTILVASPALALASVVLPSGTSPALRAVAVDFGAFGAVALVVVRARRPPFREPVARALAVLWAGAVIVGVAVAASSMPLRAMLAERAPCSFGIGAFLGP